MVRVREGGEKTKGEGERGGGVITFPLTHYSSVLFNLGSSYNLQLRDRFIESPWKLKIVSGTQYLTRIF